MSIIIFLIVLAVLILAHEFGHFIVAKKSGVRVDEFGLGFPPKLFSTKRGETMYSVNLIPFGGFVKIFGENPDEDSLSGPESERSFIRKPKLIQAAIISAGVFFNFLLAWLLLSFGFLAGLPVSLDDLPKGAIVKEERLVISGIAKKSPAEEAGLLEGDAILFLKDREGAVAQKTPSGIQSFIALREGEELLFSFRREGVEHEISVTPKRGVISEAPAIGIAMQSIGVVTLPPHRAFFEGGKMTLELTAATATAFGDLIVQAFKGTADLSDLAGPVGIVSLVGEAANLGFAYILSFVAFISINLAILNLVPFPALDGGRLLFLLIEAIKGSPVNYKIVNFAHALGFAILILLMVLVTYNDIARLMN